MDGENGEEAVSAGVARLVGEVAKAVCYSNEVTLGDWATEAASAAEFDRRVEASGLFGKVYREVKGFYLQPKFQSDTLRPRIDRILMPSNELVRAGWPHGPIGVEIEASGVKLAGPIQQLVDYTRAVWTIKEGFNLMLEWLFLWPWDCGKGNMESMAVQQRIGGAFGNQWTPIIFRSSTRTAIAKKQDGMILASRLHSGKKTGHRARR